MNLVVFLELFGLGTTTAINILLIRYLYRILWFRLLYIIWDRRILSLRLSWFSVGIIDVSVIAFCAVIDLGSLHEILRIIIPLVSLVPFQFFSLMVVAARDINRLLFIFDKNVLYNVHI